jgi:hypothetical protein
VCSCYFLIGCARLYFFDRDCDDPSSVPQRVRKHGLIIFSTLPSIIIVVMARIFPTTGTETTNDDNHAVSGFLPQPTQVFQPTSWAQPHPSEGPLDGDQARFIAKRAVIDLSVPARNFDLPGRAPVSREVGYNDGPTTLYPQPFGSNSNPLNQSLSSSLKRHRPPMLSLFQRIPQDGRSPVKKRAPKSSTMNAKSWAPAEKRIRQLWVEEELPYKIVMETVNREFTFTAK